MLALEVPVHHGARVQGGGRLQLHLQHVARRRRPQRRDADPVPVGRPGGGAPGKKLRDLGHNASVFYAIWVMMHPFFMFWVISADVYDFSVRRTTPTAPASRPVSSL